MTISFFKALLKTRHLQAAMIDSRRQTKGARLTPPVQWTKYKLDVVTHFTVQSSIVQGKIH